MWSTIDSLEDFAFDIIQNCCWLMNAMFRPKLKHRRFGTSSFLPSSLIRCYRSIHFRIFVCDEILINVFGHEKTDFCRKSSISCPSKLTKYFIVSFNLLRDKRIKCETWTRKRTGSLLTGIMEIVTFEVQSLKANTYTLKLDWGTKHGIFEIDYPKNI